MAAPNCPRCADSPALAQASSDLGTGGHACSVCDGVWAEPKLTRMLLSEMGITVDQVRAQVSSAPAPGLEVPIRCPGCAQAMSALKVRDERVDLCRKCGSLWFDKGELFHVTLGHLGHKPALAPTPQGDAAVGFLVYPPDKPPPGASVELPVLSSGASGWVAPAVVASVLGVIFFVGFYTRQVTAAVTQVGWERSIRVTHLESVRDEGPCDDAPRGVSKSSTSHGHCTWTTQRTVVARTERAAGTFPQTPAWPPVALGAGESEGGRAEEYRVWLNAAGHLEPCTVSADEATRFLGVTEARVKQRIVTRGLVCPSLEPVPVAP